MSKSPLRLAAILAVVSAAFTAAAQPAPGIDPKVRQLLDAMSTFYKSINTATCRYGIELTRDINGTKDSKKIDVAVALERPNKISFVQGNGTASIDIVSDGKTMTVSIPQLSQYAVERAPETIADALEWGALTALTQFNSIVGELMGPNPAESILDGVKDAKYIAEEDIDGKKYHHIRLVEDEMDVDMWIASGEKPFLARMSPDMSKVIANPDVKLILDITLSDWTANEPIAPERFAFNASSGLTKAASYDVMIGGTTDEPAMGLIGKPAPAFELKGLDGKPIDLSAYLGKNVIVLDFWATWCPPCVKSLPVITKVTESFKDQGVVFIAVNQAETPEEVAAFLKEHQLDPKVALDSERSAAERYLVNPLPQSVLIGKNGTVEAVHIGASPVLRQQLTNQLKALIAGQSLVNKDV